MFKAQGTSRNGETAKGRSNATTAFSALGHSMPVEKNLQEIGQKGQVNSGVAAS
jgi:hypothetical protein